MGLFYTSILNFNIITMKKVILLTSFVFAGLLGYSQCTWDGGGVGNNWGTANNWGGDCTGGIANVNDRLPLAADAVVIAANGAAVTVTVNGNFSCAGLTLDADGEVPAIVNGIGYAATLTVATGNTLTVGGSILVRNYHAEGSVLDATGEATLTIADGAVLDAQAQTLSFNDLGDATELADVPTVNIAGTMKIASIDFNNIGADFILNNAAEDNTLELYGTGDPISQYAGSFAVTGDSWVVYKSNAGGQTVNSDLDYGHLVIEGNSSNITTIPSGGLTNVVGTDDSLVLRNGAILDLETYQLDGPASTSIFHMENGSKLIVSGSSNFPVQFNTFSFGATSTVLYDGSTQDVDAVNYGNLILDQSGRKTLQVGTSATTGNVTISNTATFDLETFAFTGAGGKTLNINDDCRLALSGAANFPTGFGTFTFNTTSTVDYDRSDGVQTIALHDYANLDITGGAFTKTVDSGEAGVTGILDVEDGATIATDLGTGKFLRLISTGDGATETARIADLSDESNGILLGDGFICERDMDLNTTKGWNDWASPITNFKLASWYYTGWYMTGIQGIRGSDYPSNPFCSVLTYNAQISSPYVVFTDDEVMDKNDGWVRGPSITTGNSPGTGFRLYSGERDRELEDYGLPAQGTVAITLNYEATAAAESEEGWNLVGNPYMCAVDFTALTKTGSIVASMWMYSNVGKGYYAFNDATGAGTAPFDVLNNNSTIVNGYIPSHKAFWVKVTAATQTLTFEEAHKVTGGTAYVKSGSTLPKLRVQAQNLNNGFFSTGVIVKHDDATNGYEKYDSEIFKAISATAPNLYFLSEEGKQLSIDAVPNNVSVIPMQVEAGVNGDFELRFWDFNEIHSGSCIRLEDKFTGEWFDLREEQSIVRTLSDTTTIARFNIHINPMLNTELVANTTCFGTNDGEVLVENLSENVIGLALYDEVGALVYEDMVTNNKIWGDLAPGTYTLREATTNIGCPSAFTTVEVFEPAEVIASFDKSIEEIDLATDNGEVQFTSTSTGGEEHIWFFSDNNEFSFEVNPTHMFSTPGLHDVSLLVHNGNYDCAKVREDQVLVKSSVGITEEVLDEALVNATVVDGQAKLNMNFESPENVTVLLFDMAGKELGQWSFEQVSNNTEFIDLPTTKGIYLLKVQAANKKRTFRLF
jgi:PKD repeat protein